jgi:hypothetical protein
MDNVQKHNICTTGENLGKDHNNMEPQEKNEQFILGAW